MNKTAELLETLREAESLIGSPTTEMFLDRVAPDHRLNCLKKVRRILTDNKVKPENLDGQWHT